MNKIENELKKKVQAIIDLLNKELVVYEQRPVGIVDWLRGETDSEVVWVDGKDIIIELEYMDADSNKLELKKTMRNIVRGIHKILGVDVKIDFVDDAYGAGIDLVTINHTWTHPAIGKVGKFARLLK